MADSSNMTSSSQFMSDTSAQQPLEKSRKAKPDPPSADELQAATNNNKQSRMRIRSTRSKSALSPSSSNSSGYRVLFSTPSKYDRWTKLLLSIPLVMIFVQMISLWIANVSISNFERSSAVWCLGWTLIFVVLVYMMVLPKQVDIRSNGTIGIKTFLITHQFGDICHAYQAGFGRETMMGARYRFATCFSSQMVIRRRLGKWDVVISPLQGEEFLQTLQSVITRLEMEGGKSVHTHEDNGVPNAPISSWDDPPLKTVV